MNTKQDRSNANRIENDEIRQRCGAYHEAGHMVVASISGLRLRREGLMIDRRGWGLACYYREPEDSDVWREGRALVAKFSEGRFVSENVGTLLRKFGDQAERLVVGCWPAIEEVAATLLQKEWEPLKPLKSGGLWSHPDERTAKYLPSSEVVMILQGRGILATCD